MDNQGRGPRSNQNEGARRNAPSSRRPAGAGQNRPRGSHRPVRNAPGGPRPGGSGSVPARARTATAGIKTAGANRRRPKKHRTIGMILRNIFIVALLSVLLMFFILFLAGFRYMSYKIVRADETTTVKYLGRVDSSDEPTSGLVVYLDMTSRVRASNSTIS